MRLTERFNLPKNSPFVDIDIRNDTAQFVDPARIRILHAETSYGARALKLTDSFLAEGLAAVVAQDAVWGKQLWGDFKEPSSNHLGVSLSGFRGHGSGMKLGDDIYQKLSTDLYAFVKVGVLHHLEELALFVPGVNRDRISDITTRLVYPALADFTWDVMHSPGYEALLALAEDHEERVWSADMRSWGNETFLLPHIDMNAIVLVPRGWTATYLEYRSGRYRDLAVLSEVQEQELWLDRWGKPHRPSKKSLKQREPLRQGHSTNVTYTLGALSRGTNLLARYQGVISEKLQAKRLQPDLERY